jgi:ATP adenylyltransferase
MSKEYETLRDFMLKRMRMSHIYQPVMLKTLIEGGGKATLRKIAGAFLARDESQLEYYDEITKAMPGKVLSRHGIVARDGKGYRLTSNVEKLSVEERKELLSICDEAVERYLGKRGSTAYDHRRAALGQVSGSLRYEILKRAGGRCELCGISVEERAIEIDHITPRRHGGTDDLTNLQALCYKCNANKGARDDTDFRRVREGQNHHVTGCIFCELHEKRIVASNDLAVAIRDAFPATPLHSLIVPKRHAPTYFDLFEPERRAISLLLDELRAEILNRDAEVTGFNVGINCGETAGQTVDHAHVHLIPRRTGDVGDPRGGVRGVIPGMARYL